MSRGPADEPGDDFFVPRPDVMAALRAALIDRRERGIVVQGVAGSGKTALVNHFAHEHHRDFGSVSTTAGHLFDPADVQTLTDFIAIEGAGLHIFDGLDAVASPHDVYAALLAGLAWNPKAQLLITTRHDVPGGSLPHLTLGPMTAFETGNFLRHLVLSADPPPEVIAAAAGNPLATQLLGALARERGYDNVLQHLAPFRQPGLIGLDGQPLDPRSRPARRIITHVRDVNQELLEALQRDPDQVYQLTPRRFEEVTATLFERLGYDVTLTPASKDGGKDLYIAKTDTIGSFLYYVECKRYAPDRPVGVGLVNALTGVVEGGRATAGLMLTTSRFTSGARAAQDRWQYRLSLKDYSDFKQMLSAAGRPG